MFLLFSENLKDCFRWGVWVIRFWGMRKVDLLKGKGVLKLIVDGKGYLLLYVGVRGL